MPLLNVLTPYLLWIKIGLAALAVAALFSLGLWVNSVFAERAALRLSEASAKATVEMYAKAYNDNQKMQKEMADAVKNIRVVSNNYIQSVEDGPVPVGPIVTLVAGGVPGTVSSLPIAGNYTSGRASSTSKAR